MPEDGETTNTFGNAPNSATLQGMELMPLSYAEIDAMVQREIVENKALFKAAGLKFG